ncbi:MAG: PA14 domain-containing protein [Verrucomicrobiales bacterium]
MTLACILMPGLHAGTLVAGGGQWKVRQVNLSIVPGSLLQAELGLAGSNQTDIALGVSDVVDFGEVGRFAMANGFPGIRSGRNNFAVEITGQIDVTSPGDITFGIFADDLARLSIDGDVVVESTVIGEDALGTINLAAGLHDVRLIYYEGGGSEDLELYVAQVNGSFLSFSDAAWELLESVSSLIPEDINAASLGFPVNALAGAAVANLSASGGAGGGHTFKLVYQLDAAGAFALITEGSDWKYLDDGTLPPTPGWQAAPFDDSLWLSGAAVLGYGDDSVTTTLSFGGDADNKHAAYYLRKTFNLDEEELPLVDSLRVRMRRDDGAIIYINGVEVVRDNLPDGAVDNTTFADVTADGSNESTYFEFDIDPSILIEGDNIVAVEVHQTNRTSSDIIFDLALDYQRRSGVFGDEQYFEFSGNQLALKQAASGIPAEVGQTFDVSIRATNAFGQSSEETLEITVAPDAVNEITAISIDNAVVPEGIAVGGLVGTLSAADADISDSHTFSLLTPLLFPDNNAFFIVGNQLFTAVALDADEQLSYSIEIQARDSTGSLFRQALVITVDPVAARITLQPDTVPENAPGHTPVGTLATSDPISDTHSYRLLIDIAPVSVPLIRFSDEWKYLDDGSDQGSAWRAPGFDDSEWASGASPLGYGTLDTATATTEVSFGGDPDNKFATTYFRRTFELSDPTKVAELLFELEIDDGGIVYINGEEVSRIRADGVDSFDDYTGQSQGSETSNDILTFSGALTQLLLTGTNTIAIEVHQTNATSSDTWLNLDLKANLRQDGNLDADHFYLVGNQLFLNKEVGEAGRVNGDSFLLPVESTSDLGEVVLENVIVKVGPESVDPPTDIVLDNSAIDEQQPAGTVVGALAATDPDGGLFTFSVDSDPAYPANDFFGVLGHQLITTRLIDYDDGSSLIILVTVTDNSGRSLSREFTITVNQVLEPPTGITLSPDSIAAGAPAGTVIGALFAQDANDEQTHVFSFGNWPDIPGIPVVPFGSTWRYLDDGSDQGVAWIDPAYDDSQWASGAGQLGYGDGDEATVVGFIDTDPVAAGIQKNATTYFRHKFNVDVPAAGGYEFGMLFDDAAIVHINGISIRTQNFPGIVAFNTFASATTPDNSTIIPFNLPPGLIVAGENVIAVEIHQANETSSDISFDFELVPLETNPFTEYFAINGNQLETAVDFSTIGVSSPYTFQVPIIATDPVEGSIEVFVSVDLTGGEADSDLDGMLDTWEIARFGDLSAGGEDDNDGDGSTNGEEYNADTDPLDAGDFLRITSVNRSVNGIGITWPAKPGRTYAVYRNDDLTVGNWVLIQAGRTVEVPEELSVTDASIDNPRTRFYQVRAQAPPLPE